MKKLAAGVLCIIVWCLAMPLWADANIAGDNAKYTRIATPQPTGDPTKVEVLELFWYGCPHCFHLEPAVARWLENKPEDVAFVRMPAIPTDRWAWYAKTFYTAEVLGVLDTIHVPLFTAINDKKRKLKDPESMAEFFAEHGVPKKDFLATLNSFAVVTKVNRAKQLTRRYGITSVPTMIINGKYRTSPSMVGSTTGFFAVVDELVAKERPMLQTSAKARAKP